MPSARHIPAPHATGVTAAGNVRAERKTEHGWAPLRRSPVGSSADLELPAKLPATVVRLDRRRPAVKAAVPAEPAQIGPYRIVRKIGAGGMGVVYEAVHRLLRRRVAIKLVHPALLGDAEVAQRFLGEALAADRIRHPGVTKIYDYGQLADGTAYLVMEYLSGHTLADAIARGDSISIGQAIAIARSVASTLASAHAAGVVHRDVKPDNVFIATDPETGGQRVKLLDFGVAKLEREPRLVIDTSLGHLLGTPWYMPPEQCQAASEVDGRADIYALGCVLFELVCGQVPFPGKFLHVLEAHERCSPPFPRTLNPAVPRQLQSLILHMLAKSPDARPQTMTEVEQRLAELGVARVEPGVARAEPERSPPLREAKRNSGPGATGAARPRFDRPRAYALLAAGMLVVAGATAAITSVL